MAAIRRSGRLGAAGGSPPDHHPAAWPAGRRPAWLSPLFLLFACGASERQVPAPGEAGAVAEDDESRERERMVEQQLARRGIEDERVLAAMRRVPRHRFVPPALASRAYADHPLPIGEGQTISQPFIVAFMTQALALEGDERVLEVGSGSGYQTAILAELAREVWSIEILEPLTRGAQAILGELGYENAHLRTGDGYLGWPEHAPFDAILVAAAPDHVPEPLVDQLAVGGRMILPVGGGEQELVLIRRTEDGVLQQEILPVRFVPMTGIAEERNE
jgi:protein-L-isoaspartate(D-aspartate) O-methyltransferase